MLISPSFYSFGSVYKDTIQDSTVTVTNDGADATAFGTLSGLAAPFSLINDTITDATLYNNGDSSTVVIRFSPTALGEFGDTLLLPCSDGTTYEFPVDGTAAQAVATVTPTVKHFGAVINGSTTDQTFTVTNDGNVALIMGSLSGLAAPYSMVNNTVSGATINAGDSSTVVVRYHPTAVGVTSDTLVIPSNDPASPANVAVDGTSQEQDISVSPTSIVFGQKAVHSSTSSTVTVTNVGTAPLVMLPVTPPAAPFGIASDNVSDATIAPAGTATLSVTFAPTATGFYSGTVVFNSNDPDTTAWPVHVEGDGEQQNNIAQLFTHPGHREASQYELRDFIS